MLNKKQIMQKLDYLKDDDKLAVSKSLDAAIISEKNNIYTFTNFLDMYKVHIITSVLKDERISFDIYGGYKEAERNIICFYTEKYYELNYPIDIIEITPQLNKFIKNKIGHRDYLGSILGLGINRNKIGDILIDDNKAIAFIHNEISQYIELYLNKVGRIDVNVRKIDINEVRINNPEFKVINTTVSSLRLDAILSKGFAISRGTASNYIKGGKAFINWVNIKNPSKAVNVDDRITLRGFGKLTVASIGELTKKDRIHVTIHKH